MKGKSLSLVGVLALAVGLVLILCHKSITSTGIVVTGGILFVAAGVFNLFFFTGKGEIGTFSRTLTQIANSAAIILGICMLVFQSTFTPLVTFIFGLMIAVCAAWQFFVLAIACRPHILPGWLYLFPILLVGGAAYIFINSKAADDIIMLATGISIAVMGIASIIEGIALGTARRTAIKTAQQPADHPEHRPIEEVEATVVHPAESASAEAPKRQIEVTEDLDSPLKSPDSDPK